MCQEPYTHTALPTSTAESGFSLMRETLFTQKSSISNKTTHTIRLPLNPEMRQLRSGKLELTGTIVFPPSVHRDLGVGRAKGLTYVCLPSEWLRKSSLVGPPPKGNPYSQVGSLAMSRDAVVILHLYRRTSNPTHFRTAHSRRHQANGRDTMCPDSITHFPWHTLPCREY